MDEFKFPDEKEDKPSEEKLEIEIEGDEVEVEVVDDTPEEDRNRKPMKEAPAEVTDEELESYSESVKKRIQHFSKGYHEERRAKEAALREREEAVRFAQSLMEENKKLQGSVDDNQKTLLAQAKKTVANEVAEAKRALKEAHEAGDTEAFADAQEALAKAVSRAERINNMRPPTLQKRETPVQTPPAAPQAPPVQLDSKTRAWQDANPWFGKDEEMTGFALAVHDKLAKEGVEPGSDLYYERINNRVRQVFPDAFPQTKPKKANVVAPATRSTAPKKIVLTQSSVALAKRLGIPLEVYAREFAAQDRKQNG